MTATACATGKTPNDDPLLPLWREWRQTVYRELALAERLYRIRASMPAMVRCLRVLVFVGRQTNQEFWASTREEIVALLVPEAGLDPWPRRYARVKPKIDALAKELERRQAESAAEFERSGYNTAHAEMVANIERQNELESKICDGNSKTAVAVAALLDLALADQARERMEEGYNGTWMFISEAIKTLVPALPAEMQIALRPAIDSGGHIVNLYQVDTLVSATAIA